MSEKLKETIKEYIIIIFGTVLVAFAAKNLLDPASLVTGGVSGAAIVIKYFTGIPLWVSNTALNIPIFLVAIPVLGWKFIKKTLISTIVLSVALAVIPTMPVAPDDLLLSSVFGAVMQGIGLGMVLRYKASTGGTDMVAATLHKKIRHISIAQILQYVDGAIVVAGIFAFGVQKALYALIAIYVGTKMSDYILEGIKFAKQIFIISENAEAISKSIMEDMNRGVTGIKAVGMYSKADKTMLYCAVSPKEIADVKDLVKSIDKEAFVIVSDAREVLGEGFEE